MNNSYIQSVYQQSAARGATRVGQVVALYDTLLRDFRRALAAFQNNDIECRIFEMNHALTVIAELQNSLDRERGAEAALQLNKLYELARGLILQANVSPSPEAFHRLIELFTPLRQAWQQIDQQLPVESPREATPPVYTTPGSTPHPPRQAGPLSANESTVAWKA